MVAAIQTFFQSFVFNLFQKSISAVSSSNVLLCIIYSKQSEVLVAIRTYLPCRPKATCRISCVGDFSIVLLTKLNMWHECRKVSMFPYPSDPWKDVKKLQYAGWSPTGNSLVSDNKLMLCL